MPPTIRGEGQGEIALLDEGSRTATVTTLTPSLLLKVNNRGFEEMLEADASVREALEAEMARRLERMDTARRFLTSSMRL